MRNLAFRFLLLAISIIVGFAIGYAASSMTVAAKSPIGLNLAETNHPSARVFVEMARLKEAEAIHGSCKYASVSSSRQANLKVESELIAGLRTDAKASGLTPPLDVAEAIWEFRSGNASPKPEITAEGSETAPQQELLSRSGWHGDSGQALRQALKKIDEACK